ncbi:MAG: cupin domain-containing protein [bacterium]|nr:cupin domain-containing protein [bacterium]
MPIKINNIFKNIPDNLPDELTEILLSKGDVKIEKIVSKGHSSPDGFWYDQDKNEFVLLVEGKAKLIFENKKGSIILEKGDYVNIPAHAKHRVEWTDPENETIWLAVYY